MEYSAYLDEKHRIIVNEGRIMITRDVEEPKANALSTTSYIPRQEIILKLTDVDSLRYLKEFVKQLPEGESCDNM